jgi:ComF family protein
MQTSHTASGRFVASLRRMGTAVADTLFPPQCLACAGETGSPGSLCQTCWEGVSFIDRDACARCGLPLETSLAGEAICAGCLARPPAYERAIAVFRYDTARDLILRFKHADRTDYTPAFAAWMMRAGAALLPEADLVVPVPLHRWRLLKRRYNQAAELANAVARGARIACLPDALIRTRPTPSQGAMVSARARRRNVLAAFAVRPGARAQLKDKRVLLIDDVMTTGATLEACTRTLRRAGAASVTCLTLARVARPDDGAS